MNLLPTPTALLPRLDISEKKAATCGDSGSTILPYG